MINVFLDLDNTLISSLTKDEESDYIKQSPDSYAKRIKKAKHVEFDNHYVTFERPGLQEFLDYLFANFNVSVWTAASKNYANFIIKNFVLAGRKERELDYLLFSTHCRISSRKQGCISHKNLKLLKSEFGINYDPEYTYIIDDHDDVYNEQPKRCIHIKPFNIGDSGSLKDKELLSVVKPRLAKILYSYSCQ